MCWSAGRCRRRTPCRTPGWIRVASAPIIEAIEKSRGPYTVNALAELAAVTAIEKDAEWVAAHAAEAIAVRDRLAAALRDMGLTPVPSKTNFLFVPTPRASALAAELEKAESASGCSVARRCTATPCASLWHPGR